MLSTYQMDIELIALRNWVHFHSHCNVLFEINGDKLHG